MLKTIRISCAAALVAVLGSAYSAPAFKGKTYSRRTRHYDVSSDIGQDAADDVALHMEAIFAHYSKCFASFKTAIGDRYHVRVYADRESYIEDVGEAYKNSGGVFSPRQRLVATFKGKGSWERLYQVLYHEGFHQFFANCIEGGPPWINEGLATLFQGAVWNGKTFEVGDVSPRQIALLKRSFESGNYLRLRDLVTLDHQTWLGNMGAESGDPAKYQYTYAWSFVHYLAYGRRGKNRKYLNKYLLQLKAGQNYDDAFVSTFGADVEGIEAKWIRYVIGLKPSPREVCRGNLRALARLIMQNQEAFRRKRPDLKELYEIVKAKKWTGWRVPRYGRDPVTAHDAGAALAWFRCPSSRSRTKKVTYKLVQPKGKAVLPDIVCTLHRGIEQRLTFDVAGGKIQPRVWREIKSKRRRRKRR